jgi:hypothetical protein
VLENRPEEVVGYKDPFSKKMNDRSFLQKKTYWGEGRENIQEGRIEERRIGDA